MHRYLAVDFWWLISTQMPQPPTPPPGITTNSLLGSPPSAVDTQPIHVGAAWSHVSSNLESSICGPCSLLALAPFGRLVFWQIVRLPLISWFQGGWRVFQVIWNRQRDSGGDLLIAKRKTQSIVVYFSTSRIIASRLDPVSQSFTTVIKDKDSAGRKWCICPLAWLVGWWSECRHRKGWRPIWWVRWLRPGLSGHHAPTPLPEHPE